MLHDDSPCDILLTWPSDGVHIFESMVPLGLAAIAATCEAGGWDVAIIDFNHYEQDFRRHLAAMQPKIVGIGGTTPTRMGSFLTAGLVKEILPDTIVVYGGAHASFTAEDTLKSVPAIDYVLAGEGDLSFPRLVDALIGSRLEDPCAIPGLASRCSEGSIRVNRPERIEDLSVLPLRQRLLGEFGNVPVLRREGLGIRHFLLLLLLLAAGKTLLAPSYVIKMAAMAGGSFSGELRRRWRYTVQRLGRVVVPVME